MDTDKRKGEKPVPDHLERLLNELQMMTLHRIESFGWVLKFVRRPLFQEPVPVVYNTDGKTIGLLEEDGRLNLHPDIEVRE